MEHRPGTKMSHADALSRSVNKIEGDLVLSKEVITYEQEKDEACTKYKHYENFWADEEGVLCRQGPKEQPRVVIPATLVQTLLTCYHELPFTAHQGANMTIEIINKKYW